VPVDLHLHSSVSDGTDHPAAIVELAAAAGLEAMALTDHDTLEGIPEVREAADRLGIQCIPGVELSVDHEDRKLHLLVYFTEPGPGPLNDRLAGLLDGRLRRNERILGRLAELGYPLTMDEVLAQAEGPSVGRPHIADALVAGGAFSNRDEVFAHLLRDGGPAYVERERLTATEAITLAREQRAVPVIAHPATIGAPADEAASLFRGLTEIGLGGIEAHHPMHSLPLREHLTGLAHDLGIAATGGSDYHGEGKRAYRVGVGTGDLVVPPRAVEELMDQRG
jgi:predicted metal-dependent phosphoesterase TrpH